MITVVDEISSLDCVDPNGPWREVAHLLLSYADSYTVASSDELIVVRGVLNSQPDTSMMAQIGRHRIYFGGGVLVLVWREGLKHRFIIIGGVNACSGNI